MNQVKEKIAQYITHTLMRDKNYILQDDEALITSGLIDSFALAELAVFIEGEFDVFIPDPDLTVDKMNTLAQIVARVERDNQ